MKSERFTTETNASLNIALINEIITGPPADYMLEKSNIYDEDEQIKLLDNASGVGNLVMRFMKEAETRGRNSSADQVTGADIDPDYVAWLRNRALEKNHRIEALLLDQQATGLEADSFTHVFNNFGVFFAPDESAVLHETLRLLRSGGFASFSSWQKLSWWNEVVECGMKRYLPNAPPLPNPIDLFRKLGWTDGETTEWKLRSAGFVNVESEVYSFTPDIGPEDFAAAAAHLVKATTSKAWDEGSRKTFEPLIEEALYKYLVSTWDGGKWPGKVSALLTWGRKN